MIQRRKKSVGRKKAYVRTDVVWFKYIVIAILFFLSGAGASYYYLDGGKIIGFLMHTVRLEMDKKALKEQIVEQRFFNEMERNTYKDLEKQLQKAQEENGELKENILFYEKIIGKRG